MTIRRYIDLVESAQERSSPIPSRSRLRAVVPARLSAISDADLAAAYQMLRDGHNLDGVRRTEGRSRVDAVEAIRVALETLAREFQDGTIHLYRTIEIQDDDPYDWVRNNLTRSRSLGVYWTYTEHYVMQHADDVRVMFVVEAPLTAVDWVTTIVLAADGLEHEVRLKQGAEIKLIWTDPDGGISPVAQQFA